MTHSLQLFIYGADEIIVPHMNNFPLLSFDTPELAYDFIQKLKSHPGPSYEYPYFIINNMQLIPKDVRKLHMYKNKNSILPPPPILSLSLPPPPPQEGNADTIPPQTQPDDRQIWIIDENDHDDCIMMDGCFSIYENLNLLMNIDIYNNTNQTEGFKEYLQLQVEEENYYNSEEYHEDMREEYNDRLKYDLDRPDWWS
jgi:hypothetical protein